MSKGRWSLLDSVFVEDVGSMGQPISWSKVHCLCTIPTGIESSMVSIWEGNNKCPWPMLKPNPTFRNFLKGMTCKLECLSF